MINYFKKDVERGVLIHEVYDPRIREFFKCGEYDLSLSMNEIAEMAFPMNNDFSLANREDLIAWRGLGNENELYQCSDRKELSEIFWEHDMTYMNVDAVTGATVREREMLAREEINS